MLQKWVLYVRGMFLGLFRRVRSTNKFKLQRDLVNVLKVVGIAVFLLFQHSEAFAQKTCTLYEYPACSQYISEYQCSNPLMTKDVTSTVNRYGGTAIDYGTFISVSTQDVTYLQVSCFYSGIDFGGTGCASSNNTCEEIIPKGGTSSGSSIPVKPLSSIIKPNLQCGSIIQSDNQVVGEIVALTGASFSMAYFTSWVPGSADTYKINIPLAVGGPRAGINSFDITVQSNGIFFDSIHLENNQNSLTYTYQWNGLDSSGNLVFGSLPFVVTVIEHGASSDNPVVTNINLGGFKSKALGLGGWVPDIYAFYDVNNQMFYKGDGSFRRVTAKKNSSAQLYIAEQDASLVYIFDQQGRHLSTKTGLLGTALFTFNYDSSGSLASIIEPFGKTTRFNRDILGKTTRFNRDILGAWTSITAPNGQVTSVSLDANAYVSQFSDPLNQNYNMTYAGPNGLMTTFQKPKGQMSTFSFDTDGNLIKDAHASGYFIQLVKNLNPDFNADISVSTAMGRTTHVQSSSDGASVNRTLTLPTGIEQQYSYTVSGNNAASASSGRGIQYSVNYQGDARFYGMADFPSNMSLQFQGGSRIVNKTQNITLSNPDDPFSISSWSVTSELAGSNSKVITSFDPTTKVFSSTTQLGRSSELGIDSFERVVSERVGDLLPRSFSYTNEHLTAVKQGSRQSNLSYDSNGFLKSVTNPLHQTTSYTYDKTGRMLTQKLPDGRTVGYAYDANGNVTGITPPNGKIHGFEFGDEDQMGSYNPPALNGLGLTSTAYSYNADKQLTKILRPDGESLIFNYENTSGFLTSIITPDGSNSYTMNSVNGLTASIRTANGIGTSITYLGPYVSQVAEYDKNNNLLGAYSLTLRNGALLGSDSVLSGVSASQVTYNYDDDELLSAAGDLSIVHDVPNGLLKSTALDKITDSYSYNSFGELKKYEASYNGETIYKLEIERDAAGRVDSKAEKVVRRGDPIRSTGIIKNWFFRNPESNGSINRYFYDQSGRLIANTDGWFQSSVYLYDLNSNRTGGIHPSIDQKNFSDGPLLFRTSSLKLSGKLTEPMTTCSPTLKGSLCRSILFQES